MPSPLLSCSVGHCGLPFLQRLSSSLLEDRELALSCNPWLYLLQISSLRRAKVIVILEILPELGGKAEVDSEP